jgi:hypothetical protein
MDADVRVRLAAGQGLDVLKVNGAFDEEPEEANGRCIEAGAIDGARHGEALPLSGQPDATGVTGGEREPVLLLGVGLEDIGELDVDVAHLDICPGAVVHDPDADDRAGLVDDEHLLGGLEDGRGRALERVRLVHKPVRLNVSVLKKDENTRARTARRA